MGDGTGHLTAEFVEIVASLLPEAEVAYDDAEENIWFVFSRADAERYLLLSLRDMASGDGPLAVGLADLDEGTCREFRDVYLAIYLLMTGRADTVAMTLDGRLVPYGVDWSAMAEDGLGGGPSRRVPRRSR